MTQFETPDFIEPTELDVTNEAALELDAQEDGPEGEEEETEEVDAEEAEEEAGEEA